ncbi:MAG TPA: hypothetical protein VLX61_16790 [Anaerolineales bacterium]|nr:hypothetical protein [Anaerolineales bacterium]
MRHLFCVLNSDAANLYGGRFSVEDLVSGTYQTCTLGIPSLVAHDHSRPIGWVFPKTVYIEPGLTRAAGFGWLPEGDEEREQLIKQYKLHYHKTYIEPNKIYFDELAAKLKPFFQGGELKTVCECVAYFEPGLATRVFAELFRLQDKDGLVPIESLKPIGPGIYRVGEFVAFAHNFFRRNLCRWNSLNYPLLTKVQDIGTSGVRARIALDLDIVGLAASFLGEMLELQYWWGPKFSEDLTSIPRGVTHYEASETDRVIFGISGMEFRWGIDHTHHIFEAEELRDVPSSTESNLEYGCRYVHSMIDTESRNVVHLDGAIRSYSEEKMIQRLGMSLDHAPRDTVYTKLWRVDGEISVPLWKSLISDYYRDNYLVGEYFGAEDDAVQARNENKEKTEKNLVQKYVPYSMSSDSGVRVALSFSNVIEMGGTHSPRIIALDTISNGSVSQIYVENCGLELKKALKKHGVYLSVPTEIQYVSFKDLYANFPLIFHDGANIVQGLRLTLDAVRRLIQVWMAKGLDMVVCYKVGFPVDIERVAVISVIGHVKDMMNWLSSEHCYPPTSPDELGVWAEKVAAYLTQTFPGSADIPALSEVLMQTGVLLINRQHIDFGNWTTERLEEEGEYRWGIRVPEENIEQVRSLEVAGVVPGFGFLIKESRCTRCGNEYRSCECSKMLDDNVAEQIRDFAPFPFWTDRPLPGYGNG